jgi:hypothetical protein
LSESTEEREPFQDRFSVDWFGRLKEEAEVASTKRSGWAENASERMIWRLGDGVVGAAYPEE